MRQLLAAFFSLVVFMWVSADGVVWFTDDKKRIPEAYQSEAIARDWDDVRAESNWTRIE